MSDPIRLNGGGKLETGKTKGPTTQIKFFKKGERSLGSNLDRKLQELVNSGTIKIDMLHELVAEHETDCVLHPDSPRFGSSVLCNCDVEIYTVKGKRLA
jgi:hypothetical protein